MRWLFSFLLHNDWTYFCFLSPSMLQVWHMNCSSYCWDFLTLWLVLKVFLFFREVQSIYCWTTYVFLFIKFTEIAYHLSLSFPFSLPTTILLAMFAFDCFFEFQLSNYDFEHSMHLFLIEDFYFFTLIFLKIALTPLVFTSLSKF